MILETIHYHTINEPQYLKNLVSALDEMNLPTGEDKKNPLIDVKVKLHLNGRTYGNMAKFITMKPLK